ncbi:hypothetical protein DPMN_144879 [Dreissena polymorpha]|uniref:Reverse transcriptase n=1 Tax=Dreissena polymorpha TaxID=45954 RepID=A0A9D4F2W8_DREPO|nr:hypothetical protein DPMN_144879 [Dreissena polymorpha]
MVSLPNDWARATLFMTLRGSFSFFTIGKAYFVSSLFSQASLAMLTEDFPMLLQSSVSMGRLLMMVDPRQVKSSTTSRVYGPYLNIKPNNRGSQYLAAPRSSLITEGLSTLPHQDPNRGPQYLAAPRSKQRVSVPCRTKIQTEGLTYAIAHRMGENRGPEQCCDREEFLLKKANPCHKINIYSPIKREDRAYTRLRLRVSRLHGYYYKPVNCPQCNIPNTFEHLFFVCSASTVQRIERSGVKGVPGRARSTGRSTSVNGPLFRTSSDCTWP